MDISCLKSIKVIASTALECTWDEEAVSPDIMQGKPAFGRGTFKKRARGPPWRQAGSAARWGPRPCSADRLPSAGQKKNRGNERKKACVKPLLPEPALQSGSRIPSS